MSDYGQIWIEAIYADDSSVQTGARITQADPTALIAWDLLDLIRGGGLPYAEADGLDAVTFIDTEADKRIRYTVEGFVGAYGGYALRRDDTAPAPSRRPDPHPHKGETDE